MRWLVLGSKGFVGGHLCEALRRAGQDVVTGGGDARLRSHEDCARAVLEARPDRVVCCVGRTHTPTCGTIDAFEDAEAWPDMTLANHDVPVWLAAATATGGPPAAHLSHLQGGGSGGGGGAVPMLYLGTGCIYYDASGRAFSEEDPPNFFGSAYSRVKAMTDAALRPFPHVLVARIRMPLADEDSPRDILCKLLSYPTIVDDGPNSLSALSDVLPALLALCHAGIGGVFNAVNPGALRHSELLAVVRAASGRCHAHRVMAEAAPLGLRAPRSCCTLSADKLQAELARLPPELHALYGAPERLPSVEEALRRAALRRRRPRRLLVTGGCGFIGCAFVDGWLARFPQDAVVNVDCLAPECGARRDNVAADAPSHPAYARYAFEELDLAADDAEERLRTLLWRHAVDTVVHLAARTHVDESFDGRLSLEYTRSNVLGTHRLLEAARRFRDEGGPLQLFLHQSTDEVYGETLGEARACEATTVLRPSNPYAASKAGAEMLVGAYAASHGLPCVVVRCNNCYGPRQHATKVVPRFCELALAGEALPLHGGGAARRAFVHVDDVVEALVALVGGGSAGEVYNVGSGHELSVVELARAVLELAGSGAGTLDVPDRPFNDSRYHMDDEKLRSLGWRPARVFSEGLAETLTWHRDRAASGAARRAETKTK
jgi:dTDP-glucose 4,6-dehydratase